MKKDLLKTLCSIALSVLLLSGCKKVTEEELKLNEPIAGKEGLNQANTNTPTNQEGSSCRLRTWAVSNGYAETFRYNRKGLVDEWRFNYPDGFYYDYFITYEKKDRLLKARMLFPGDAVDFNFYTDGKHITRCSGYLESNDDLVNDIFYVYNNKGQMIRLIDVVAGVETRFYYDNKGYNRRSDMYINNELIYTLLLNYDIPNKNPNLALPGIDFGFPNFIFMATQWDKRWNSSGDWFIYDNGNPIVIASDDPAQTVIHTGQGNYATYAKYYDIPSESFYDMTFSYSNCNGNQNANEDEVIPAPSVKGNSPMPVMTRLQKILQSPSKNKKQQLLDLKKQLLDQVKARGLK